MRVLHLLLLACVVCIALCEHQKRDVHKIIIKERIPRHHKKSHTSTTHSHSHSKSKKHRSHKKPKSSEEDDSSSEEKKSKSSSEEDSIEEIIKDHKVVWKLALLLVYRYLHRSFVQHKALELNFFNSKVHLPCSSVLIFTLLLI